MERVITGFHADEEGDWVAELVCGHRQHVRHRPPFQVRPWVLRPEGRTAHLGTELACPLCDRTELPEGLRLVRSSRVWSEHTMPPALRHAHRIAPNFWGRLVVLDGRVRFRAPDLGLEVLVDAMKTQGIPPDAGHLVEPLGRVRFFLEFHEAPRSPLPVVDDDLVEEEAGGGDPACWAHLVSEEFGTIDG